MSLCFLQCYKSSKEQTPLLDVSLLGCSVVYKEKQLKRKEHKLKIIPVGAEAIVLALQSKEQTEQWLRVILPIHRLKAGQHRCVNPSIFPSSGNSGDQPQASRKLRAPAVSVRLPQAHLYKGAFRTDPSLYPNLSDQALASVVALQGELSERHSLASESGSSTDSHAETSESKDGELFSHETWYKRTQPALPR